MWSDENKLQNRAGRTRLDRDRFVRLDSKSSEKQVRRRGAFAAELITQPLPFSTEKRFARPFGLHRSLVKP
jgi:hypothetical protein